MSNSGLQSPGADVKPKRKEESQSAQAFDEIVGRSPGRMGIPDPVKRRRSRTRKDEQVLYEAPAPPPCAD